MVRSLQSQKQEIGNSIDIMKSYQSNQEKTIQEDFDNKIKLLELKFKNVEEECLNEYYKILSENAQNTNLEIQQSKEEIEKLHYQMEILKSEVQAAQAEKLRVLEEAQREWFYCLQLDEIDLKEIKLIKSISPNLRDSSPLNKIIWSSYYRPSFNELRGRVLGNEQKTGIYKLVNRIDGRVYIGQARDVATRWSEHIKAGLGAASAPNNKLYTSMRDVGPENFSFVLLEECIADDLNQQEKFWIDFYDSKTNGLNETVGNNKE